MDWGGLFKRGMIALIYSVPQCQAMEFTTARGHPDKQNAYEQVNP